MIIFKNVHILLGCQSYKLFEEIREGFLLDNKQFFDYDDYSALDLVRELNEISYNAGCLMGFLLETPDGELEKSLKVKILKHINTVVNLYKDLYCN